MNIADVLAFTLTTFRAHRLRLSLMLLATAVGVASVIVLASLGEGARRYVVGEFASLGTDLLIVFPGKSETTGAMPPVVGEAPRDLTIADAKALLRSPAISRVAALNVGEAAVTWQRRERQSMIIGSNADMFDIRRMTLSEGKYLPPGEMEDVVPVAVIGEKLRNELFGNQAALGQWLRIDDRRFRVIGVLAPTGQSLGMNMDDVVIIPVASAQQLFNQPSLFRLLVEAKGRENIEPAKRDIIDIVKRRHDNEEDITVITQDSVLSAFDRILNTLTMAVAGIASISLIVAGVLIMNVMLVAVSQRRGEIGLLKAIGASSRQIMLLFMGEAGLLSLLGGGMGLAIGLAGTALIHWFYPVLPVAAPLWVIVASLTVCIGCGMLFGILPARRAAQLDPVAALARR